ncbi:MAG: (2Fe-2S) ferredoxin domain-containing protein [Alphaproteobacteria bacterium]
MADPELYYNKHVFCCTTTRPPGHPMGSCGAKGSDEARSYLKGRVEELGLAGVQISSSGCLGRCGLGPLLVIYPEGVWYTYRTSADLDEILSKHLTEGGRVERLMLTPESQMAPAG